MSEVQKHKSRKEIIDYFDSKDSIAVKRGSKIIYEPKTKMVAENERPMCDIFIRTKGAIDLTCKKITIGDTMVEVESEQMTVLIDMDEITQYAVRETMTQSGIVMAQ